MGKFFVKHNKISGAAQLKNVQTKLSDIERRLSSIEKAMDSTQATVVPLKNVLKSQVKAISGLAAGVGNMDETLRQVEGHYLNGEKKAYANFSFVDRADNETQTVKKNYAQQTGAVIGTIGLLQKYDKELDRMGFVDEHIVPKEIEKLVGPIKAIGKAIGVVSSVTSVVSSMVGDAKCGRPISRIMGNAIAGMLYSILKDGAAKAVGAIGGAIGKEIGTQIGAAIGSVIPGLGTIVGAVMGRAVGKVLGQFLGEKLGEWAMDKLDDKVDIQGKLSDGITSLIEKVVPSTRKTINGGAPPAISSG